MTRSYRRPPRRSPKRRPTHRRLGVEMCEDRRMLATITVTSELDTGAVGELRWAINTANALPGPDEIAFAAGVDDIQLTQGQIAITDSLTVNGPNATVTPVTVHASPGSRIFRVSDSNPFSTISVSVNSMRLQDGNVANGQGGAILNTEDLTLRRTSVVGNTASQGGGIANLNWLTLEDSRVVENRADLGGGGLWNAADATSEIQGSRLLGNSTPGAGGAVLNDGGWLGILGDSEVAGNFATENGGGVAVVNGGLAHFEFSNFHSNTTRGAGGAIFAEGVGTVLVSHANVVNENDATFGGGMAFLDQAIAGVRFNVMTGNLAAEDGGAVLADFAAEVEVTGSEISNNQAGLLGPPQGTWRGPVCWPSAIGDRCVQYRVQWHLPGGHHRCGRGRHLC